MVVLFLLRLDPESEKYSQLARTMKEAPHADNFYEPRHDAILQMTAKILAPIIILLGIYVVLNGHLSPGGGFSGGAIMGAGLMIYVTAFGFKDIRRFFTYKTYQRVVLCSLLTYAASKCYSFYTGANDIHSIIPLGTPGAILSSGLILVLNICVGLIVTCTMYAFYAVFRKGEGVTMLSKLLINYEETASVILFCIGFSTMLLNKNLIKKIIGMDIMDTAVYLFLASQGYIKGRTVPIVVDGIQSVEAYINPIPAGLVLTGIVVSVSVSALMLALSIRLYYRYNTLNLDEIIALSGKEEV